MMSLTFGLFTQVSGSGPLGPLVFFNYLFSFLYIFNQLIFIYFFILFFLFASLVHFLSLGWFK